MKYKIACLFFVLTTFLFGSATAQFSISSTPIDTNVSDSVKPKSRLTIGGYGEAVYKYNFYSDNMFRYSHAEKYADAKGHGRVDLPHAVFMMSYDFGKGWTFNTEVEFEHGGTESAVEVEAEETGEFEKEIERGGEVALEQFWLQKSFLDSKINIRLGHIIVPVGGTNLPAEMSNDIYVNLMVWHRGLAVPAARDLDNPTVQRGRELFREIGCASCHRPSWTTGNDRFTDPNHFFTTADQRLPRFPNQKIWPYTDMIHNHQCF